MAEAQPLDLPLQPLGYLLGDLRGTAWEHRRKLLATDAPEQVAPAQHRLAGVGDALQNIVALLVAVGVVDLLEVIDIQQQEGQGRFVQPGGFEGVVGAIEEVPAVAALGQHIGGGQALQFTFELLFLGDVFGHADHDHSLVVVGLLVDKAFVAEPADFPVGGDDAVLAVFHGALYQHLGQAALGVVEVVGVDAVAPFVEVGQQQAGGTPENAFVGRAHVEHLARLPVEGPEHGVDAVEQRTEQLLAFTQAGDFTLGVHERQQGLGGFGGRIARLGRRFFLDHERATFLTLRWAATTWPATRAICQSE